MSRIFLLLLMIASPLYAQHNGDTKTDIYDGQEVVANEVLVKFRPTTLASIVQAQISEDVNQVGEVGGRGALRFHSASKNVATLVRELAARADVEYVEPNYIVHAIGTSRAIPPREISAAAIPNDPRFGELWGLQNTLTPGADISAVPAWDISTGSRFSVAVIVDTGIDYNHPDLMANAWSAPANFTVNIGGLTIPCLAGTHGFNAITKTCDPLDDNNHGTHVSGTIGAVGNNGIGIVGVNWTASIMGSKFLKASGSGTTGDAIDAIEFAIQAKAAFGGDAGSANVRILSNSWGGGGFSQALLDEISKANASNMLFVAAAGNLSQDNDTTPHYPSSYNTPNMVGVASTTSTDALSSFSSYGATSVHLGAPGSSILSTVRGGGYSYLSGTSMATPHVTGAALLVLSTCALDTAALKTLILENVDPIPSLSGITITGGRLNVNKAIRACGLGTPDFSLSTTTAGETVVQGDFATYTVNLTPSGGFAGSVTLSVSGLPDGAIAAFDPNPATDTSTLTVITDLSTPVGKYMLTITGVSGSLTHSTPVTLVVTAF
ncbi:MAG TPA: S8 family serine peptidase [Candidatus Dormibacteraeota bacterium]|nr:S8 family serine peptidase [Candidatus Dormibacteraeota bacterium]